MSNETEKPLAGALRAAQKANACCCGETNPGEYCTWCVDDANFFARESGLAELVELILQNDGSPEYPAEEIECGWRQWEKIVVAARRVREGESS